MWTRLKTLLTFDAFCKGCEIYHEMLVAMGFASTFPAANRAEYSRLWYSHFHYP
jgi:hypothetical protein